MSLTEKLVQSKNTLEALLEYANRTTGVQDISIGDAIKTLADGYGGGTKFTKLEWLQIPYPFVDSNIPNLVLPSNFEAGGKMKVWWALDTLEGNAANYPTILGNEISSANRFMLRYANASYSQLSIYATAGSHYTIPDSPRFGDFELELTRTNNSGVYLNGEQILTKTYSGTFPSTLFLFASGAGGANKHRIKFKGVAFWKADGTLLNAFYPYLNSDGVAGVLDEVTGIFYIPTNGYFAHN